MNYIKANNTNCNKGASHLFVKIQDVEKQQEIREYFHPFKMYKEKMPYPLWKCNWCNKITQST